MKVKSKGFLALIVSLAMDSSTEKMLEITHHRNSDLYTAVREGVFLMIQAPDAFLKSEHKYTLFHASTLYFH